MASSYSFQTRISYSIFISSAIYNQVTVMHAVKAYGRVEFHSLLTSAQDGVERSVSHAGGLKKESPIPTEWEIGWPRCGH
jgi:hypothetical protein